MQVVLNFPDSEAAHVLAFLNRHPAIQLTPTSRPKAKAQRSEAAQDTTEQLLSNPANRKRLLAAVERARQGKYELHDLIEDE